MSRMMPTLIRINVTGFKKCGDTARGFLELREQRILADKFFCFGVFTAERAYDTCAVQIFTRGVQNGIQLVLNSLVALDGQQHDAEYHNGEQSDHNEEQQRAAGINGERHNACAEHNERRAHKQAQYKVHTVLHLIYVICDACQQRGSAHTVQKREGEFVDFLEQAVTQPVAKPTAAFAAKILRRDGTDHADHTEPDQKQTAGDKSASHIRYKFIWFQDKLFTSETAVIGHESLRFLPRNP